MIATTATIDAATIDASPPQHMLALQEANKVRLARAELKRRIAAGDLSVADVVVSRPEEVLSMPISDLLLSQRRWGLTRCRKFLAAMPMSENKTVGSMTERQRVALAAMLSSRGLSHATEPPLSLIGA